MNIKSMSDSEKSVILAKLNPAWKIKEFNSLDGRQAVVSDADNGRVLFRLFAKHNFFTVDENGDPHLMPQAWRVLNWAMTNNKENQLKPYFGYLLWEFITRTVDDIFELPPAKIQRLWLDKILSLTIKAGMMEESE